MEIQVEVHQGPKGPLGPWAHLGPKGPNGPLGPRAQRAQGPIWIPNLGPGPQFWGPGLAPGPKSGPGPKIWPLGPKISKLPLEKPCRIQYSVFQTEPYVARNGRKPFRAGCPPTEANVSADKTSVVSADKTSVVSADKTSVVSLCQQTSPKTSPSTFPTQGRPRSGRPCVGNAKGDVLGDVC